ncbi:class IIb bacteriocin, lactobin A/cerein 7B family [Streptococcus sp. 19428wD3_AN2]|nr:class IIb bacteriocin, lactobin A/cerein 7B family [Streptococcus sp. 19428wD3_AN2]TFU82647.1 class IIb bacteriocin, lactobin A/cerein 7B family [Streptococcus sp. AN2]
MMADVNTNYVALTDEELMNMEGGAILTATVFGVAAWKLGVGVIGAFGAGAGLAYYANRP